MGRPPHASERAQRAIVGLVVVVYVLLIGEGIIRKWLLPEWSEYLFFIRDPFVIAVYALALLNNRWPRHSAPLWSAVAFALVGGVLALLQGLLGHGFERQALFAAYGWRNYFLYAPLAFVIGAVVDRDTVDRIVRWTLIASIPIAALAMVQFYAPIDSPINVGSALDEAHQFRGLGLTETRTRPMGTFTSSVGQSLFVASCMAMVLSLWMDPGRRWARRLPLLVLASAATFAALAFSGSRGAVANGALLLLAAAALALVIRKRAVANRALAVPLAATLAGIFVTPLVFAEGYSAFLRRWSIAYQDESTGFQFGIVGRALYGFVDFVRLLADTPLLGFGLGLGENASSQLGLTIGGLVPLTIAETDWARHIVDLGPVLGLLFIGYRVTLVLWIGRLTLMHARRHADPLPFMLFAFLAQTLLLGQIAGHGTANGYCWIFLGLCLAAMKLRTAPVTSRNVAREPRFPNIARPRSPVPQAQFRGRQHGA